MRITQEQLDEMRYDLEIIAEAIRGALVEIEQCEDISQGVEDDLRQALAILEGTNDEE